MSSSVHADESEVNGNCPSELIKKIAASQLLTITIFLPLFIS